MPAPTSPLHPHEHFAPEPLEPRFALSGVTIITHGQQIEGDPWMPPWMPVMADAIDARLGSPATRITTAVETRGNDLVVHSSLEGPLPTQTAHGEIIILLNWFNASQGGVSIFGAPWADYSTEQVGDAVMPELLRPDLVPGLPGGIGTLPIHLIGHSRGGSLVSELGRLFVKAGIWVDQITTLDPHPRDFISDDAEAGTAWGVGFADNYWQDEHYWPRPNGESLGGQATDRKLGWLDGGYESDDLDEAPNHSDVRLWYFGTIDRDGDAPDGNVTLRDADRDRWYAPGELRGANAGFAYSRIGGLSRFGDVDPAGKDQPPRLGLHPLLGGPATREESDVRFGTWPNIISTELSGPDDGIITPLGGADVLVRYWDADSAVTITAYLDSDTYPLNGVASELLGSADGVATPGRAAGSLRFSLDPAQLREGRYYLQFAIRDADGRTRYLPSRRPVDVDLSDAAPDPTSDAPPPPRIAAAIDPANPSYIGLRTRLSDGTLRYHDLDAAGDWSTGSVLPGSTPPIAVSDPVYWRTKSGARFTAYVAGTDLIVIDESATTPTTPAIKNLSEILGVSGAMYPELDLLDSPDGKFRIVGRFANGDVVLFTSPDGAAWSLVNLSAEHLRANGRATPAFEGAIVTYTTSWGGLNIAGLTAEGTLWSIWTSPEAGTWYSSDLSATAGTPRLVGGLAPYITPWGGINLAGIEPGGTLSVTWWVPGFGGEWRRADFSSLYGAADLITDTMVSYVTPWNALNIAGVDRDGKMWVYWWEPSRAGDPERDRWTLSRIDPQGDAPADDDATKATGPITPLSTSTGRIDLFSTNASGDPVRLWWDASAGDFWSAQSLEA